jgi:hypothetical protein
MAEDGWCWKPVTGSTITKYVVTFFSQRLRGNNADSFEQFSPLSTTTVTHFFIVLSHFTYSSVTHLPLSSHLFRSVRVNSYYFHITIKCLAFKIHNMNVFLICICVLGQLIKFYVRFEVFTEVTMKNAVFWHVIPCGSCKNRSFGGMYSLHHQGDQNRQARNNVSSN